MPSDKIRKIGVTDGERYVEKEARGGGYASADSVVEMLLLAVAAEDLRGRMTVLMAARTDARR